jgi:hypothetical protein
VRPGLLTLVSGVSVSETGTQLVFPLASRRAAP